eukprot:329395-Prymnesium_polylepis.1
MGDLAKERKRLIAAALAAPPLDPAAATIEIVPCGTHEIRLRTPSDEVILQEHVRHAHEIAMQSGADYDETMRVECARLTTERPTYWGMLWPGGVALGALLIEQPALVAGRTVLEVGTGLGITGVCAAVAGASAVLATDHEAHSLLFTAQNALENGVAERVQTARLDWTEPTAEELLKERFDVVLAADVLYEDETAKEVARLMRELVRPRGLAIFSDGRDRIYLDAHTNELLQLLRAGG